MLQNVVHLASESLGKFTHNFTAPLLPRLTEVYGEEPHSDGGAEDNKDYHHDDSNGWQNGGGASGSKGGMGPTKHKGAGEGKSACGCGGGGRVFDFMLFLQEHTDSITFQARMAGEGEPLAAIKTYDTEEARDTEAARYRRVQGLEDVPQLLRERLRLV